MIFETEDAVVDLTKSQVKSTGKKIKRNNNIVFLNFFSNIVSRSTPVNTSSVECKEPLLDSAYCLAKSSSTVMEDYIYAKVRCYNGNGSLADQEMADENNASFVSATCDTSIYINDDYAYGNHIYELAGYEDVIHETYDEF